MKLLTPTHQNDLRATEATRDILRAKEAREMEQEWRMKLAKAEADFNDTLVKNRKVWEEEQELHNHEMAERKREIDRLEAQKINALIPFGILKKGSDDRMMEAEKFLADLRSRDERIEELTETLEDRLDDVGQREQDLHIAEQKLIIQKENLEIRERNVKEGNEQLISRLSDFYSATKSKESELQAKETAVSLREQAIKAKEQSLISSEKTLSEWNIRLTDERDTLKQAWDELERKKVSP